MKRNTLLQRDAIDRLGVLTGGAASKISVKATDGIFILTGKVSSDAEICAASQAEGIRFYLGLLYASAISVAFWLTLGGVVRWVTR